MAEPRTFDVFKCMETDPHECQTTIEFLQACGEKGDVVCCGTPMKKLVEKTEDTGAEKHVPVVEKVDGGIQVKIGAVPHPMEEDHYIQWCEVRAGNRLMRHLFKPGDAPEAVLPIDADPGECVVRELCNLHGLWRA